MKKVVKSACTQFIEIYPVYNHISGYSYTVLRRADAEDREKQGIMM
jgi:hypothetical protein